MHKKGCIVPVCCTAAGTALLALSGLLFGGLLLTVLYRIGQYVLLGICSLWLAYRLALCGVPAILAWLAAPILQVALYFLLAGMAPLWGAVGVSILIGMLGGSAGEVRRRR